MTSNVTSNVTSNAKELKPDEQARSIVQNQDNNQFLLTVGERRLLTHARNQLLAAQSHLNSTVTNVLMLRNIVASNDDKWILDDDVTSLRRTNGSSG